jgi:hypothetical protein
VSATIGLASHHDIRGAFDESRIVEVRGIVTKVEWRNPHPVIEIQETDRNGKTKRWTTETQAIPNALERRGWSKVRLAAGDPVTVRGFPARTPSGTQPSAMVLVGVTLADGTKLDASSTTQWGRLR